MVEKRYPNIWKPKKIKIKQTELSTFGKQFGGEFSKILVSGYKTTSRPAVRFEKEEENEKETEFEECPDCGVAKGHYHKRGCDVERCPRCGHQLISCLHGEVVKQKERMKWTGEWPGVEEARQYGLYTKSGEEDLNKLYSSRKFRWSREKQRFVRK